MIMGNFQLTLAILKPDVVGIPFLCQHIKQLMLNRGFLFVRSRVTQLSLEDAKNFYSEHRDKFFFKRLTHFMSSGPISVHIIGKENAIQDWRQMLGPTKVLRAQYDDPTSLRGEFGITDTRNVAHGSDSKETVMRETSFFFPNFSCKEWKSSEEVYFSEGKVNFCPDTFIHIPIR